MSGGCVHLLDPDWELAPQDLTHPTLAAQTRAFNLFLFFAAKAVKQQQH